MTILKKGKIYEQWLLTVLFGSLVYTAFGGAANMGTMIHDLTAFEKLRLYVGCFIISLFYSFITAGVALYLNRVIYSIISCESAIRKRVNWVVFLLFPPIVSMAVYCAIFPFIFNNEGSYFDLTLRVAKFLTPWIVSSLVVTILLNKQMPSAEEIGS